MTPEESFAAFADAVHSVCPDQHAIDLHPLELRARAWCGEHGRVVPTSQQLCPKCAGYVEPVRQEVSS